MSQQILLLHGFATSSRGRKGEFLAAQCAGRSDLQFEAFDFNPTPVDFEYLTVTGMINRLRQYLLAGDRPALTIVGSSMGGLVALNYAHRFGGVDQLLLLAPALTYLPRPTPEWQASGVTEVFHFGFDRPVPLRYDLEVDGQQYLQAPPPPAPITIIHGRQDEVVPFAGSAAYAAAYPDKVRLLPIEAGHDVNGALPFIWDTLMADMGAGAKES